MQLRACSSVTFLIVAAISLCSWHTACAAGLGLFSASMVTKPNPAFPTTDAEWYDSVNCPSWLTEYIEFHASTKGTAEARYLVFSCHQHECYFGLGDRLRGILMFLRAAAASKRVLLIDIDSPVAMEDFFMPSLIDWSVGDLVLPKPDSQWMAGDDDEREILMKTNAPLNLRTQFLVVQGFGALHTTPIVGGPDIGWADENTHCVQRSLFKPSMEVQSEMTQLLGNMDLDPSTPYTAVHLRFGGLIGEEMQIHRYDEMATLHTSLKCARELANTHGMDRTPVVLITDNMELKAMLLEGGLANVRTTNTTPVHTGTTSDQHLRKATYLQTVADMGVLAGAACLVVDDGGGFGLQARIWGGSAMGRTGRPAPCFISTKSCLEKELVLKKLKAGGGFHGRKMKQL